MEPKKSNIIPFDFYVADASAGDQAAQAMSAAGEATVTDCPQQPCPWAGSIVGISVQVEGARTGGTLTIRPTINGSDAAEELVIDDDPAQYNSISWRRGEFPITAGQRIGADWSTASWTNAEGTPSVRVVVYVHVYEN
jgi:hypothetical protein